VATRSDDVSAINRLLEEFPIVAILGPRQVGKTTLANVIGDQRKGEAVTRFDLERPSDVARLMDAETALSDLTGLIIIDEVQRRPDLFPLLRVLADRRSGTARFLILGSASPDLLRQGSESLAGRIAFHELRGFRLDDIDSKHWKRLWLRGGFPRSYLAASDEASFRWREQLVQTYLERDIPQLGLRLAPATLDRFWSMLAHYHGQTWNGLELARAFAVSDKTVRNWLDILEGTFMVRSLKPWSENVGKRTVKAPKIYVEDPGILHTLLRIANRDELERHPKLGASFEGFGLAHLMRHLASHWGISARDCYFWATHQGAELDLLVVRGNERRGFEFKRTVAPEVTKSMSIAMSDLRLSGIDVIHAGQESYPLTKGIRAVAIAEMTRLIR
jgi:predicted AAA+ superfamily ATPase